MTTGGKLANLTRNELKAISDIRNVTLNPMERDPDGVEAMFRNSMKRARDRSPEQVMADVCQGYGAELLLADTGMFTLINGILENIEDVSYSKIQRDLISNESKRHIQVKTTRSNGSTYGFSEAVKKSIVLSTRENDDFLVLKAIPDKTAEYTFVYTSFLVIDSDKVTRYISQSRYGPFLAAFTARDNGHCVLFDNY